MGVNGCGWVRWGITCMGGHRNKARTDKNGLAGHMSVAMAGEISPDIMFLWIWQKVVQMGADGYILVRMGALGCGATRGAKNRRKRRLNDRVGHVLQRVSTAKISRQTSGLLMVTREEYGAVWSANKGCAEEHRHQWYTIRPQNKQQCQKNPANKQFIWVCTKITIAMN